MNRKYKLKETVKNLFSHGKLSLAKAEKQANLDYEALSQALNYAKEPVYRCRTDNYSEERCEYRSGLLLKHEGTLLYTQVVDSDFSVFNLKRCKELWILDDLTLIVISKVEVTDSHDRFSVVYRELRTSDFDEIPFEIDLDLDELADNLWSMSESFRAVPMPFQEL